MDSNPEIRIPLGKFLAQRRASGNEHLDAPAQVRTYFGIHNLVRQLPFQRLWNISREDRWPVRVANRVSPAIDRLLGFALDAPFHLKVDLFVYARNANENRRPHLPKRLGQVFEERTIGQRHSVVKQGNINVSSRHMGQRQERQADVAGPNVEACE